MRDLLIGIFIGLCATVALSAYFMPEALNNAVHRERMMATQNGVGAYELDTKEGAIVFKYVNLDEYTKWLVFQVQSRAQKTVPLQ